MPPRGFSLPVVYHDLRMALLLICTVGGSPEPLVKSILSEPRPDKVVFVCSRDTRRNVDDEILPKAAASGLTLGPAQHSVIELSDPQDLAACVREMERQVTPHVRDWRAHDPQVCTVTVDPTGGTKVMSIALALVARRWDCTFRYIGGKDRQPGPTGPGAVQTGAEVVLHSHNPLDFLGYQVVEEALTLCSANDYAAACRLLDKGARAARDPGVSRALRTLAQLTGAFAAWDRFAHGKAMPALADAEKNRADLDSYLAPETCLLLERRFPDWRQRLEILAAGGPSSELVEDLLANAARRRQEGRYDDAVARLYRAVEAMAQWRLASAHDIPDTGKVPAERLPESLRSTVRVGEDGTVELGLQKAYELLEALGDPLGRRFRELGLHDEKSPLAERNLSILAHGWKPVTEAGCEALWKKTTALAAELGISEAGLFRFPELKPRSA